MASTTVRQSFSLDGVQDSDLLKKIAQCANLSAVVREALRAYWSTEPSMSEVYTKLCEISDKLETLKRQGVMVVEGNSETAQEVSDEIEQNLNSLLGRFKTQ